MNQQPLLPLDIRRTVAAFLGYHAPMERSLLLPETVRLGLDEYVYPSFFECIFVVCVSHRNWCIRHESEVSLWPHLCFLPSGEAGMGGSCYNCGALPYCWEPCPFTRAGWPAYSGRNPYRYFFRLWVPFPP